MIWAPNIEQADRTTIEQKQLTGLQDTVKRVYDNVPYYRKKLDELGIKPSDIRQLSDVRKLPFTVKDDLRAHYPFGLLAVPMKQVNRIHASSGTTGSSTVVAYTKQDLENWSECIARLVCMAGGSDEDIAQIAFGYGLFTGGFGLHYGLEKVGAAVIPMSSGNTKRQIQLLQDFGTTLLICTPTYAMYLAETAESMGVDLTKLPIRTAMVGGEGHTEELRRQLEKRWGMNVTENYGLSEVMGPGVSGECLEKNGMHINEDQFLVEIIDPETGEVLPEGEKGEVVITPLAKQAQPLLRYRTRDLSCITYEPCQCGRTTARMHKIMGRSDDMLVIRGVNVFPSQIEKVLLSTPGVGTSYEIIVSTENFMDKVEVMVEVADAGLLEEYRELEALKKKLRADIKADSLIDTQITLCNPMTLKRFEGKAQRVQDLRKKD